MTTTITIELLGEVPVYFGVGLQTLTALLLGGLVGYDRERKAKAAGLKTHMLICLGACIFTSMGIIVATAYGHPADPNRIAAQIVSGIGFLGAGAIIRGQEHVVGLTSAATIWLVAAIGYTIGSGFVFSAAAFTLTVFLVLVAISPFYKFIEKEKEYKYFQIEVLSNGSIKRMLMGIILSEEVVLDEVFEEDFDAKRGLTLSSVFLKAHTRQIDRITHDIKGLIKVKRVTSHSVAGSVNKLTRSFNEEPPKE